jgi:predicted nucleotidyltransferase
MTMPQTMQNLIEQYIAGTKKIYGSYLCKAILFGSYARGDFRPDSDVDIMILLGLIRTI